MKKHSKITENEDVKKCIDEMLTKGISHREISNTLKMQNFSISHTAIRNYDKDYQLTETKTIEVSSYTPSVDMEAKLERMNVWELEQTISKGIARELYQLEDMRKNGMAVSGDTKKALDSYEKGQNLINKTAFKIVSGLLDYAEENLNYEKRVIVAEAAANYFRHLVEPNDQ